MAFIANPTTNFDLFHLCDGGGKLNQLTRSPLDERSPAISPGGRRIAYATSDGALWVITIATKAKVKLPLPPGRYGYPASLPDGSGIVYTSYQFNPPQEDADLFVYHFQDGTPKLFLKQTGVQDYAALSPSGDRVAYVTSLATLLPGFGGTITQQLWVVSLRDGQAAPLHMRATRDSRPAWSPDGKWIVFSSDRNGNPHLWLVDAGGGEPIQLTSSPAAETSPAWSPDGREIVYVSTETGRMQLMIIDVKTRATRALRPFGASSVEVRDPHWR